MNSFTTFIYLLFLCLISEHDFRQILHSNLPNATYYAKVGSEVCMGPLGCFKITEDFFHWTKRPINLLPQDRKLINVQFYLYSGRNIRERHILDADRKQTLIESTIHPEYQTFFICHGYIDNEFFGAWLTTLKDELLLQNKTRNIIIVDWSGGNKLPYTQATANTRVVGAEIARMVIGLETHVALKRKDVHIIGHSLGSHIAGYAGERLPGLGRITGLDPAEPYFQGLPPTVRLDEGDAKFVDAIHTDSSSILVMGLGMSELVAHVDFFPNDGKKQPGCVSDKITSVITEGLIEGGRRFVACNHQRSVDFFTASINRDACISVGYKCPSWDMFLEGKCSECGSDGSQCSIMGLRAVETEVTKPKNLKVFLKTSGRIPFCIYHYNVAVKLHKTKSAKDVSGTMTITLNGNLGDVTEDIAKKAIDLYAGSRYSFLVTSEDNIGEIKSALFYWVDKSSSLNPLNWLRTEKIYVEYILITPMNIVDKTERLKKTKKLCMGDPSKPVKSKQGTAFTEDKC